MDLSTVHIGVNKLKKSSPQLPQPPSSSTPPTPAARLLPTPPVPRLVRSKN